MSVINSIFRIKNIKHILKAFKLKSFIYFIGRLDYMSDVRIIDNFNKQYKNKSVLNSLIRNKYIAYLEGVYIKIKLMGFFSNTIHLFYIPSITNE